MTTLENVCAKRFGKSYLECIVESCNYYSRGTLTDWSKLMRLYVEQSEYRVQYVVLASHADDIQYQLASHLLLSESALIIVVPLVLAEPANSRDHEFSSDDFLLGRERISGGNNKLINWLTFECLTPLFDLLEYASILQTNFTSTVADSDTCVSGSGVPTSAVAANANKNNRVKIRHFGTLLRVQTDANTTLGGGGLAAVKFDVKKSPCPVSTLVEFDLRVAAKYDYVIDICQLWRSRIQFRQHRM